MNAFLSFFLWLKKNQLLVLSVSFFLIWKLTLVFLLWQNRTVPPEPDDSYSYISTIASASKCGENYFCDQYPNTYVSNYASYVQFSYRLILGTIARITSSSPENVYEASYYFGTILLLGVLLIFLRSITKNQFLISLGIIFLSFYHGAGEIHGFYWVVPSFFSVLLFFLIISYLFREKLSKFQYLLFLILIPIFILTHPTSVYFIAVFFLSAAYYFIFTKNFVRDTFRKLIIIFLLSLITISAQTVALTNNGQDNPYGFQEVLSKTISIFSKVPQKKNALISYDITSNKNIAQNISSGNITNKIGDNKAYFINRISTLKVTYFQWFFPHWLILFPFFFLIYLLYVNQEYKIISLYCAAFTFFVISTLVNEFGFRSAILLWPITYLIYAFGLYYLIIFIKQNLSKKTFFLKASQGIILFLFILFASLNALYAATINTNLNARNNYRINKNFETYLLQNLKGGDTIYIPRIVRQSIFGSELFFRYKMLPPSQEPKFIVILQQRQPESNPINQKIRNLTNTLLVYFKKPVLSNNSIINNSLFNTVSSDYQLDHSFGDILIYKKIKL